VVLVHSPSESVPDQESGPAVGILQIHEEIASELHDPLPRLSRSLIGSRRSNAKMLVAAR
jgi:hypothetical protein